MISKKLALLGGAGTMGTAIIEGLLSAGAVGVEQLTATARHLASLESLQERGVAVTLDNAAAASAADVVLLLVHPDDLRVVAEEIAPVVGPHQLVISVVTGITNGRVVDLLGQSMPVIRANPNICAVVGASVSVLCPGRYAQSVHVDLAAEIFGTIGTVQQLDERHMNVATALAGCGPAFMFKCIEALAEGAVKMGMPRDAAKQISAQVLLGAAKMVLVTGRHPAALKDEVTTPGGCTIDGITKLEERGLPIALIEAVEAATKKAAQLFESDLA